MNKIIQKNQSGFTLIEIMIAMVVFSIGLLGVAAMQIAAVKGNSSSNGLTEAATIAQNKMEELMILDNYQTDPDLTNGPHVLPGTVSGATSISYNISWNITDNTPPPATTLKTISVTVNWNQGGRTRQVVLDSLKADI